MHRAHVPAPVQTLSPLLEVSLLPTEGDNKVPGGRCKNASNHTRNMTIPSAVIDYDRDAVSHDSRSRSASPKSIMPKASPEDIVAKVQDANVQHHTHYARLPGATQSFLLQGDYFTPVSTKRQSMRSSAISASIHRSLTEAQQRQNSRYHIDARPKSPAPNATPGPSNANG